MIREIPGRRPRIHPGAYIDPAAQVIGDVTIADAVSIWPGAVVRGDENYITIGASSNVQDNSVVHVTGERPCIVGAGVTIAHRAVIHGCTIGDNARVGIGAVVLTGVVIEDNAQVGAGAVVAPGKVVPAGWLAMGVPARPIRKMSDEEIEDIRRNARVYVELWRKEYPAPQPRLVQE